MGYFVESLCVVAFVHLNLPVVLQYFFCCRSLTKSATAADKENKVLGVLNLAADVEEFESEFDDNEHDDEHDMMQPSPYTTSAN